MTDRVQLAHDGGREDTRSARLFRDEPAVKTNRPWDDDKLERQVAANTLANLVKNQKGPFVVSLDGKWGTGKTFFLKRWKQQLENDGIRCVYFNAWRDDFFEDPLVPFLAEIMRTTQDFGIRRRVSESFRDLAYRNVQSLTSRYTGVNLPELGDDIVRTYDCQTKTRSRLREALIDLVKSLQSKPLVVIIDELDRCRPDFAIATLERTKHILSIPGLVFVYGINRRELCKSVASLYGNINADVYVRRFFDIVFPLPAVNSHEYCTYLTEQYEIPTNVNASGSRDGTSLVTEVPAILSTLDGLSLRDIEQCIRIVAFVASNLEQGNYPLDYQTIVAVAVIRLMNNDLYQRFARGEHVAGQMIDYFQQSTIAGPSWSQPIDFPWHGRVDSTVAGSSWLSSVQGPLYALCDEQVPDGRMSAYDELKELMDAEHTGKQVPEPTLLAGYTRSMPPELFDVLVKDIESWRSKRWHSTLGSLMELAAKN